MRRWFVLFAAVVAVSACGGGEGGGGADGPATFTSDDGVVTVDVPRSAAPDGFTGTISLSDPSALGVDTSDVDSVLLVYELGPDGTEFDEPVTVTFRIPPSLGGFDPDLGLPLSLIAIEDGAGGFEPLGSMRSFLDGDVLVVEGTTTHFSTAVVEVGNVRYELVVDPPGRNKNVDSLFEVSIMEGIVEDEVFEEDPTVDRVDYSSEGPIDVFSIDSDTTATMECTREGVGTIKALVYSEVGSLDGDLAEIFLYAFFSGNFDFLGELSLEIECVDDSGATASKEIPSPPTGSDPQGDGKNGESQPVTAEDDVPGGDIEFARYEPGPAGENCFIIKVYGDGETTAADATNEIIDFEVVEPDGELWQARAEYFQGEPDPGFVWVGPKTSGRDTVEGATVTPVWEESDTLRVCVDSGGTILSVATFSVTMNVFTPEGSYYDSAEGIAES